jgi:SAM-dependent methyltransferase
MTNSANQAEGYTAIWNGSAGDVWVEMQEQLDRIFAPVEALLADEVAALAPRSVLDVGCGTGATTLAAARRLAGGGYSLGIDVSEAMIETARQRARREGLGATFVSGDAQRYVFARASVDLFISRFGVMFFDDFVAAFANLHHAAREGAQLRFVTWRGPEENPYMTAAESTAAPFLPDMPVRDPAGPGQFGLADAARTQGLLQDAGWTEIDHQPIDFACSLSASELERYFTRLGPVGTMLQKADAETRARVIEVLQPAFAPFVVGDEVRFTAACWLVSATAG